MRIECIRIEGDTPVSGSLGFPREGLALWSAANDLSETVLVDALATALYGPTPRGPRSVAVDAILDDGRRLRLLCDPAHGLTVEGPASATLRPLGPGTEPGQQIFGLSREEFLSLACIRADDVRSTVRDVALRRLLGGVRTPAEEGPLVLPSVGEIESVSRPSDPTDLMIVRSPAEELYGMRVGTPGEIDLDLELNKTEEIRDTLDPRGEDPAAPATERIRKLRHDLANIQQQTAAKTAELQRLSEQRAELRSERNRLGLVADEAPADPGRLDELANALRECIRKHREHERERAAFDAELGTRGVDEASLRNLDQRFAKLSVPDLDSIATFDEVATVRRGKAAVIRTECRLEESKVAEIATDRVKAVRGALIPLGVAAVGLLAGVGAAVMGAAPGITAALLAIGCLAGIAAGTLYWRARTSGEDDRVKACASLAAKKEQLAVLDEQQKDAERRLAQLATRVATDSPKQLREEWNRWKDTASQLGNCETLARKARVTADEMTELRTKLSAFLVGTGLGDLPDIDRLQATIEDYQRFFRTGQQLADADARCAQLEAALTRYEAEQAELRRRIHQMLSHVGIDPDRDLDEAIEMFALRSPYQESETSDDAHSTYDSAAPAIEEPLDTSWIPRVSATAEAILRRFLPLAREVEVDEQLVPTLRLDARSTRMGLDDVARDISATMREQVCLALRLAIVETLNSSGERVPLFLDDPWARADEGRYAAGLALLVEDLGTRRQIVLRTSQEVRVKWFLHQYPAHRSRITAVGPPATVAAPMSAAPMSPPPLPSPSPSLR